MTVKQFVSEIQTYYGGQYNQVMGREMVKRLAGKSDEYLDRLFSAVIERHSAQYKSLPDVAVLTEAMGTLRAHDFAVPPMPMLPDPDDEYVDPAEVHALVARVLEFRRDA